MRGDSAYVRNVRREGIIALLHAFVIRHKTVEAARKIGERIRVCPEIMPPGLSQLGCFALQFVAQVANVGLKLLIESIQTVELVRDIFQLLLQIFGFFTFCLLGQKAAFKRLLDNVHNIRHPLCTRKLRVVHGGMPTRRATIPPVSVNKN